MRTIFLDLETTGRDPSADEILSIGIMDDFGNILMDSLVRPVRKQTWTQAQLINGIAPADVRDAPSLDELRPIIRDRVAEARVVIYHADFDRAFLLDELAGGRRKSSAPCGHSPATSGVGTNPVATGNATRSPRPRSRSGWLGMALSTGP